MPKLAESWNWESEGRVLHVHLRKNVAFHDGTPLRASLATDILRAAFARPANRSLYTSFSDVVGVRAAGEYDVLIDVSQPSAFLPEDLELPIEIGNPAVGAGAYKIVKREPSQIILQGNDQYYLGAPRIGTLVIRPFGPLRSAWSGLLRGEVDMVTNVPPDAIEFVQNDDVQVLSFGRRYQYVIAFNVQRPPFNNRTLRRALNSAIDRKALINNVLGGHGVPSTGPLWPQYWAYDSSLPSFGFDPALAINLLSGNGFTERVTASGARARLHFTCMLPANFALSERIGLDVQKQLYDVGIDMQFEVVTAEEMDTRIRKGQFDAVLLDMVGGPTLSRAYMFWGSRKAFKGLNLFGFENPEAERLFSILKSTTNEGAVRSATRSLQRVLLDDPPALFLAWNERSRAVRREFKVVQDLLHDPADPVYTIWRWIPAASARRQVSP